MPIEFACPSCGLAYRVKDELAGKGAKCKCGHRITIPKTSDAKATVKASQSAVSARPKAAKSPQPSTKSWLDEELESFQSAQPPIAASTQTKCPSCGAALTDGAVLCVACGFDSRTGAKHETKHVLDSPNEGQKPAKRTKIRSAASLMRGTFFSFLGAMLGAIIWAVFTYFTGFELGYIAWGLGGLAGLGMAFGHDDDDGTFAGIIAAFMSLVGIVAAKVLIIVIFIAAIVSQAARGLDSPEFKRAVVADQLASEKLRAQGVDDETANEEQFEKALTDAQAEVAKLSEEELDARLAKLSAEADAEETGEDADAKMPADADVAEDDGAMDEPPEVAENADEPRDVAVEDPPNPAGEFFRLMFSPIDGLFILLAFFTAYKIGSGQMSE